MVALVQPSGWELAELGDFAEFQDIKKKKKKMFTIHYQKILNINISMTREKKHLHAL